jgi:uncharacterized protein YbjT (DUF2867 family)
MTKGALQQSDEGEPMKIVVIGGAGVIGARTVAALRQGGHEVVAASRRTGIDIITGEGLQAAMDAAQVAIDVSNPPSTDAPLEFFETASRNVLAAAAVAGVRHHVALSIVGADRAPGQAYYRAKIAQEQLIETSGVPYTIVRATQFLEFLGSIADGHTHQAIVRLPPALLQPVAADEVAAFVAGIALSPPRNGIVEIAGPERAPFADMIARYLKAIDDRREVATDVDARYFGGRLEETSLVPEGAARLGQLTLEAWARERPGPPISNNRGASFS